MRLLVSTLIASNERAIINGPPEWIWAEATAALSWHLSKGTEENEEKS